MKLMNRVKNDKKYLQKINKMLSLDRKNVYWIFQTDETWVLF